MRSDCGSSRSTASSRPHGSLYLHVDWRTAHHVRLLLDDVFGAERFLNEIVWAYDYGGRARDRWPRKHDTILWYAKGDRWIFDREAIDRIPYLAPGLVGPEKAARGKLPTDVWWMTIVPPGSAERTGYPTQKPVRLAGADRRGIEPAGRPRARSVRGQRDDGRRRRAPGSTMAAGRPQPGGRRDRPPAAVGGGEAMTERTGDAGSPDDLPGAVGPRSIEAVTLDFGNTLVPVSAAGLRRVVRRTAEGMADRLGPFEVTQVLEHLGRGARATVPRGGAPRSGRWTSPSVSRGSSPGSGDGAAAAGHTLGRCRWRRR